MTQQQLLNKLKEKGLSPEVFYDKYYPREGATYTVEGIGNIKCVKQHGGEGKGDSYMFVLFFEELNHYLAVYGDYNSYDGADFEYSKWVFVEPKEVTAVEYKSIKGPKEAEKHIVENTTNDDDSYDSYESSYDDSY